MDSRESQEQCCLDQPDRRTVILMDQTGPDKTMRPRTLPAEWGELVGLEDWRYLSDHLSDERMHDVRIMLRECPPGVGANLVAEIRTLIPGSQPDHALVLALARLTYDADSGLEHRRKEGSQKELP